MVDQSSQGKPKKRGGRIRHGWELAKQSWRVVKGDRSLLVFPLVSAGPATWGVRNGPPGTMAA
ncbi:MAG: hypothetical protein ACKOTA_11120 [Solirubrobacterales bacterium]